MDNDELLVAIKGMFEAKVDEIKCEFEEAKRHTEILVENLRGDIKAIAEGHSLLNDKMDRLEGKVDKLENKVDRLEIKVDRLEIKVDRIETDMTVVKDYVIGVDEKLNEHEVILRKAK